MVGDEGGAVLVPRDQGTAVIAKTQAAMSTEAEKWRSRPGRYGRYHLQPLQRRQHHWNDVENELCAVMPMGTLRMLTPEEQTAIAQCLEQLPPLTHLLAVGALP